ncbi:hypothetical protein HYDPIDRAFT_162149 [Hydnomerulius pinastri MD-312]|uniref:Core domain-containing protein n=1 Tax=Hydnomerulius pinastri MD-312 TaxID=994086 RepID=A0A0C9W8Z5_9AGAM|nr:hypothetical protein HYDPIDRAFT_162149 [Hydnomerulius pinastri MD-312]
MSGTAGLVALTRLGKSPRCWKHVTHSYFRTSSPHPRTYTLASPTQPCVSSSQSVSPGFSTHTRHLSSSAGTSDIPKAPTVLLTAPTTQDLEEREMDVDLIPQDQIQISLTNRAAEQLRRMVGRESNPNAALRIAVESGGCHGYQYKMELATKRSPEDYHLTHPDIRPSNLYIDPVSLSMINGSIIDYATELIGSSFRVAANPQAKGGCGCGISWELKE